MGLIEFSYGFMQGLFSSFVCVIGRLSPYYFEKAMSVVELKAMILYLF